MQRQSGLLLHPTALPGPLRVGDLGKAAFRFVDFLVKSRQQVWQILPLGPTGYGHSPYNALSAFAGNPALIDLQQLVDCGDLSSQEFEDCITRGSNADFSETHSLKRNLLTEAGRRFFRQEGGARHHAFELFCRDNAAWLDDFSLFMALRDYFSDQAWSEWPQELRTRQPQELARWQQQLQEKIRLNSYQQFVFTEQWQALKRYANQCGIKIFGDIPIFVAYDSSDVWANQRLFQLDAQGQATAVAGVPPDYFSATGQRWGNPLYRWEQLAAEDYRWWISRFEHQLQLSDLIRIDHFRGFQACWSIPAHEETAVNGQWQEVPGRALFSKLRSLKSDLPIVAEDLGVITAEVEKLRDDFAFPGMKILQFAFDSGPDNPFLPENYASNAVVYTGTHDNNTTLGWWRELTPERKEQIQTYLNCPHPEIPWELIRLAMASVADLCIIPCQDILALGKEARFNTPGLAAGNWSWQMGQETLTDLLAERLAQLTEQYHRTATR